MSVSPLKKPFIAGNWKMNLSVEEAERLASDISRAAGELFGAEIVLFPPFTSLYAVRRALGAGVQLGAQNMHWEAKGAYTGEVSPPMLVQAGCRYVILGHSERRQFFSETDEAVNKKIQAALASDLTPIFCLGETLGEREEGRTMDRIASQMTGGFHGLSENEAARTVIAYEPVWAIGTGKTATPAQAQEVHAALRADLRDRYGKTLADCAIILYGGSVKPDNAFSLAREKDIDGFLVGGASLEAPSFIRLTVEAMRAYREKK